MIALTLHQLRYDLRAFWRNGQARFFTIALPVLFLLIFASVFGNDPVDVPGGTVPQTTYYVPVIVAQGVVSAGFANLVITLALEREAGTLKRRRATPVPAAALIASRALVCTIVALVIAAVLMVIGAAIYGAHLDAAKLPAVVLAVVVGTLAFAALGTALVSVVSNEDAATPVVQAITLPLYFISGIFVPADTIPSGLLSVSSLFPIRHLAQALLAAYNPAVGAPGIEWGHLGVVALWGAAGAAIALRRFSWVPRDG